MDLFLCCLRDPGLAAPIARLLTWTVALWLTDEARVPRVLRAFLSVSSQILAVSFSLSYVEEQRLLLNVSWSF